MTTDLRQAAIKALEALESDPDAMVEVSECHWDYKRDLAITALRTALAEPEHDTDCHLQGVCQRSGYSISAPRKPEPEQPVAIYWTLNGDKHCGYDNWVGETPFGRILITWKSWKDFPNACVDEFPGGFEAYGDPEKVKVECEAEFRRRIGAQPASRRPVELTDEQCDSVLLALDEWARNVDDYDYGLPLYNEELREKGREVIRAAHGITGETK